MEPQASGRRVITGIRSTGDIHLGNYLGAIQPAITWQDQHECLFFIADLHSLTSLRDPAARLKSVLDVYATWITCGVDTSKTILFRQSDVPAHTELTWYLSCVTGIGMLEKAHAFKEAKDNGLDANMGLFCYPLLMAADILLYDVHIVPVGKDQKQHVEMARDFAGSFNAVYGETLVLPNPSIKEEVMIIPGLDGRKMSKSYNNTIPLFCSADELKKKVFTITTDSSGLAEPKEVDGTAIGELYKHFASPSEWTTFQDKMRDGGRGWGHAKQDLVDLLDSALRTQRDEYNKLRSDEKYLKQLCTEGGQKAQVIADSVIRRVREKVGVATWR